MNSLGSWRRTVKNITHFDMEEIKTLKQRLKPEILANIEAEKDTYPNSYNYIMDELNGNVAVTQLTLETINSITTYSPTYINKITDIYDMFDQ